jgi:outer membrane protein assembly factor BamE (lipoprotein component of BamABCDE complex)
MSKNKLIKSALIAVSAGFLLSTGVAFAATGYTIKRADEAQIKIGMDKDEVRRILGRPAHNMKYRNEPGRSWTYGVLDLDANLMETNTEFDIDFDSAGKVVKFQERIERPRTKESTSE